MRVQQSDQIDPNPANDTLSLTLNVGPAPPIPPILRVRKVRTDFFDHTPIAEVEIDQAALDRLAPFTTFSLEGSSNLRDWEFLEYVGLSAACAGHIHRSRRSRSDDAGVSLADVLSTPVASLKPGQIIRNSRVAFTSCKNFTWAVCDTGDQSNRSA